MLLLITLVVKCWSYRHRHGAMDIETHQRVTLFLTSRHSSMVGLQRPLFPMGWNYGWLYLEPGKQCCRELICALPTLWGIDTLQIVFSIYSVISQPWFIPWAPQRSRGILSSSHPHSTVSNASVCPQTHLQTESTGNISWVSFWLRQQLGIGGVKQWRRKSTLCLQGAFTPNLRAGKAEAGSSRVFAGQLVYSKWWVLDSVRDPKLCRSLGRNWHCHLLTLRESNSFQGLVHPSWMFTFRLRNCQSARLRDLPTHSQLPCQSS